LEGGGENLTVKISFLNRSGHEVVEVTPEEAERLREAYEGRYVIVDARTKQPLREVKVEDGQELYFIPPVAGG